MELRPLQKTRLFEVIVEQIQSQIKDGSLKPGEQLPGERELAERLNVSRTAVREAIRTLEMMGCVDIKPGEGVFVKEVKLDDLLKPIKTSISVDKEMILNLLDARDVIEVEAAKRAAVHATEEDIQKMSYTLIQAQKSIEQGGIGLQQDNEFHICVAEATQNPIFVLIMNLIADLLVKSREATLNIPGEPEKTLDDHKEIYQAIACKNPEKASTLMKEHIFKGKKNIIRLVKENGAGKANNESC